LLAIATCRINAMDFLLSVMPEPNATPAHAAAYSG
jgi:hypothetical protein